MSATVFATNFFDASHAPPRDSIRNDGIRRVQKDLTQVAVSSSDKQTLLNGLIRVLSQHIRIEAATYFYRDSSNCLTPCSTAVADSVQDDLAHELIEAAANDVAQTGEAQWKSGPRQVLCSVPVPQVDSDPEVLVLACRDVSAPSRTVLLTQLAATHISQWTLRNEGQSQSERLQDVAAMVELNMGLGSAADFRAACQYVAVELAAYLGVRRVAVGWRSSSHSRCRLMAVSDVARCDRNARATRLFEAAMDEGVLRNKVTQWPGGEEERHGSLAHRTLCSVEPGSEVVSVPLRNRADEVVGALVVLNESAGGLDRAARFLELAERSIAASLDIRKQADGGPLRRAGRSLASTCRSWRGLLAALALTSAGIALAVPFPHQLSGGCQVEPSIRRFVAAPFDGTLEIACVKPGDLVSEGDVMARMDGREVRWETAGLEADRQQAVKKRDAAQASHSYGEQRIAELEIERLDLKLRVLEFRASNLEVRSPVDGIVTSGDLERAVGAPLSVGQTLFEVAPLTRMIAEVAIADDEVAHLREGQSIQMRLDAYPGDDWEAKVLRVQPRSEIRDEENVFIAEAELDNRDGRLRPGMKGRAKITAGTRTLGWIFFHKPWEYLTKMLCW